MRHRFSIFVTAMGLALLPSCKREQRGFHVPPPSAEAPANVPVQDPIRPGPNGQPLRVGPTASPSELVELSNEPFGRQFDDNAQALSDGNLLYEYYNCIGCHAHGGGGIGPPLLDKHWFYGSQPQQIYTSIVEGRPNGMPSFRGRIADYQIWELVAYVRSMSGQANPNAAPGREDHMRAQPPPNSKEKETPDTISQPTTRPASGHVG